MKLNHKLIMVSAAALMSVSPFVGTVQNVQAATTKSSSKTTAKKTTSASKTKTKSSSKKATSQSTSTKKTSSTKSSSKTTSSTSAKSTSTKKAASNTIKLVHNAYVYDKNGKRLTKYMGSAKYTTIAKGVTLKSNGTVKIDGVLYYSLGNNAYIKAVNVDGPSASASSTTKKPSSSTSSTVTAVRIKIARNSYVYDENGKRIKKYEGKDKLTKGTTVDSYGTETIDGKLYYQLNKKGTAFVKASNVDTNETATITLKKNAYIYDGNGDTKKKKIKKGKSVKATEARYIGTKLYYKIGDDQFVKAANVGKVSGAKLDPINEPDGEATVDDPSTDNVNPDVTKVTTIGVTPLYNIKGQKDDTRLFGAGQSQQVSELRYIATSANGTPDLFYKLASGRGYLKASDVIVSGKTLSPVNTPEQAKADVTVATAADKTKLSESINNSKNVKNSTTYKLSSSDLRNNYDKAVSDATAVNNNASATIAQVNEAVANINEAYAKLNGQKIVVANLSNLTLDEANQIVKLVASVRNVPESNVQFSNNNTTLAIVSSNGYNEPLNISDFAQQR